MKAFAVVVLMLLCGCFAADLKDFFRDFKVARDGTKLFKDTRNRNKFTRDEQVTIINMKPLPCSAEVKFAVYQDGETMEGVYKQYRDHALGSTWMKDAPEAVETTLRRTDIKQDPKNPTGGFYVTVETYEDECEITAGSYVDNYYQVEVSMIQDMLNILNQIPCVKVTEATYDGKKCQKCLMDNIKRADDDTYIYIKDGYTIGVEYGPYNLTLVYDFKDVREDMVISESCKAEGLPQQVYSAPAKDSECKTSLSSLKLKVLPCSYGMKYKNSMEEGVYKKYGYSELSVSKEFDDSYYAVSLIRADIHVNSAKPWSALQVYSHLSDDCTVYEVWYEDNYTSPYTSNSPGVLSYCQPEMYCIEKKDTKWEGKECTQCSLVVFGVPVSLYVKDGLVIGADAPVENFKEEYEYMFEDFRNDMALNKTCTDNDIPAAAYEVPAEVKDCGHTAAYDAGSVVSAAAAMIVSMVMITLISLF